MMVKLYKDNDWYCDLIYKYAEQYLIKRDILKKEMPMSFVDFIRQNLRSCNDSTYQIDEFMKDNVDTSYVVATKLIEVTPADKIYNFGDLNIECKYSEDHYYFILNELISEYLGRDVVITYENDIVDKAISEKYRFDECFDYLTTEQKIMNMLIFNKDINIENGDYYNLEKNEWSDGDFLVIYDDGEEYSGVPAELYYSILHDKEKMKVVHDIQDIIKKAVDLIDSTDTFFEKDNVYAKYFTDKEIVDFIKSENIMNEELLRRCYRNKDLDKNLNELIYFYNEETWK